jgi:hemoglobin
MGGREAVARLVDGLYDRFETDAVLRPAFSRDLMHERTKVKLFFEEWFGGASIYFNGLWPPGLKAAHGAVSISEGMAHRWVGHFFGSWAEAGPDPVIGRQIRPLISRVAGALVNRAEEPVSGNVLAAAPPVPMNASSRTSCEMTPLASEAPLPSMRESPAGRRPGTG